MANRWKKYYKAQMEDEHMKALVEAELAKLRIGTEIAKARKDAKLSKTRLAARAGMAQSKISAIENHAANVTLATLIRIARAAGKKLQVKLV